MDMCVYHMQSSSTVCYYSYWNKEVERWKNGRSPRMWLALVKTIWWRMLLHGTLIFLLVCISVYLPVCIQ